MTENTTTTDFPELSPEEFNIQLEKVQARHAEIGMEIANNYLRLFGGDVKKTISAIAANSMSDLCALIEGARAPGVEPDPMVSVQIACAAMEKMGQNILRNAFAEKMGLDPDQTKVIFV